MYSDRPRITTVSFMTTNRPPHAEGQPSRVFDPPHNAFNRTTGAGTGRYAHDIGGSFVGKRELIDTGNDKRFVRRDERGRFKESVDVGRSLSADRRREAKNPSEPGHGDRGDRAS
jgi:hypothetical protein